MSMQNVHEFAAKCFLVIFYLKMHKPAPADKKELRM